MIANGMKAVAGKAYLLISGLTPMPHAMPESHQSVLTRLRSA
jgi:hypothetical protein